MESTRGMGGGRRKCHLGRVAPEDGLQHRLRRVAGARVGVPVPHVLQSLGHTPGRRMRTAYAKQFLIGAQQKGWCCSSLKRRTTLIAGARKAWAEGLQSYGVVEAVRLVKHAGLKRVRGLSSTALY